MPELRNASDRLSDSVFGVPGLQQPIQMHFLSCEPIIVARPHRVQAATWWRVEVPLSQGGLSRWHHTDMDEFQMATTAESCRETHAESPIPCTQFLDLTLC